MAKKVTGYLKLQVPAGRGQSVAADRAGAGSARHQHHGVLQGRSTRRRKRWRRARRSRSSSPIYQDKSFTFEMKTPPVSYFLKKAAKLTIGLARRRAAAVAGTVTKAQVREIAETEDEGPERDTDRSRDEDDRGLRPFHGPRRWRGKGDGKSENVSRQLAKASTARSSIRSTKR